MEFHESSADHEKFTKIIETFIRPNSPFEINISSKTRAAILDRADATSFAGLKLVGPTTAFA